MNGWVGRWAAVLLAVLAVLTVSYLVYAAYTNREQVTTVQNQTEQIRQLVQEEQLMERQLAALCTALHVECPTSP